MHALQNRGISAVTLHGVFGEQRDRYISRAKIALNIHAWDDLNCLETVRLSLLLANQSFVISEEADHDPYDGGVVYAPYERLVDACVDYLSAKPQIRDEIAEKGYLAFRKLDLVSILRTTLEEMGHSHLESLVSSAGWSADPYYSQSRPDMVAIVPTHCRRILDIGCAGGMVGAGIKQRQACHVTGVDIAVDAVSQAARLVDLAICGDAFDVLPSLPDAGYDCVLMLDVLEHVADTAGLLRLTRSKLSNDGTLILCVPNIGHWSIVQGLLEGRWDYADQGILDRTHLRFFTLGSLQRVLDQEGLAIVDYRTSQIPNQLPSEELAEMFRRNAGPGSDAENNMHTLQFILTCRKI